MRSRIGRRRAEPKGPPRGRPASVADIQTWATTISGTYSAASKLAVGAVLDVGAQLIEAKRLLGHGRWLRMFTGQPHAVRSPLKFSPSTATRLMRIAKHPVLSNRAHVHALPPSWGTLYELTKLDRPVLEAALQDGRIHPGLERREVAALPGQTTQPTPPARRVVDHHDEVLGHVRMEWRGGTVHLTVGRRALSFHRDGRVEPGTTGLTADCPECTLIPMPTTPPQGNPWSRSEW